MFIEEIKSIDITIQHFIKWKLLVLLATGIKLASIKLLIISKKLLKRSQMIYLGNAIRDGLMHTFHLLILPLNFRYSMIING